MTLFAAFAAFTIYAVLQWEYSGCFTSIAFSVDGSRMLTRVGGGGQMILWDVNSGREIRTMSKPYHGGGIDNISFSPAGDKAVTGGTDGIIVWSVETGEMIHLFEGSFPSHSQVSGPNVVYSPDGRYILTAESDERIVLWHAESYTKIRTFVKDPDITGTSEGKVHCIGFSPDGRFALSGGERLILWNVETGRIKHVFSEQKKNSSILNAIITADGLFVLSESWEKTLRIWSIESGEQLQSTDLEYVPQMITFSPDGRFAVTGKKYFSKSIQVLDIEKGGLFRAIPIPEEKEVTSFSMSRGGGKVAVGLCGRVELWDIKTGKAIQAFRPEATLPRIILDTIFQYIKI